MVTTRNNNTSGHGRIDAFRAGLHFPVGVFATWLGTVSWVLCLVFSLGFLAYEVLEDWRVVDRGYKDVFGFLLGIAAGSVAFSLLEWIP